MSKKWISTSILLLTGLKAFGLTQTNVMPADTTPSPAQTAGIQAAGVEVPRGPQTPRTTVKREQQAAPPPALASFYIGLGPTILNVQGFTGLIPKLSVGYGTVIDRCKKVYLAGEIFAAGGTLSLSHNQRYRVNGLLALSAIPGYKLDEWTFIFARVGIESAYYSTHRVVKTGGLFGLGFQSNVQAHWDMRAEYNFMTDRNLNQYSVDVIYKFS